jgi:uncharacterized protein YbjQ (UPF0145 family)
VNPDLLFAILPLILLLVGSAGIWIDREHRKELAYRRGQVGHVLVTNVKTLPGLDASRPPRLCHGEVVLSVNRLITLVGRIKLLFGGEVKSFHDVITRARQEAVLRLIERAAEAGYDAVGNVRVEPVDVAGVTVRSGRDGNKPLFVGVIAYGTAYHRQQGIFPPPAPPTLMIYPN